jgi:gamma-glutamyltranspeptidase/glutathione hydrolase
MNTIIESCQDNLAKFPATASKFLPSGKPIKPGTIITMPKYAETLEKIARTGSDALYNGEIGKTVADYMEDNNGLITMKDLSSYRIIKREPICGIYRKEYEVYSIAPGSSGGTHIIQMLNILESFDVGSLGYRSVEYLHLLAETLKIAFSDRQKFMGDPSEVDIPLRGLTSKKYACLRAKEIGDSARIYVHGEPFQYNNESSETTHVSAMDGMGNMVSATQTLNGAFGSSVTIPSLGVLLNNCMALFDPRPKRANSVAGGKRMLSSMSPTIVLRSGKPYLCIGTPGGLKIFPSVTQAIVNIIDFNMGIQEAVEAPRIWTMGIRGTPGEKLILERGFPESIRAGLREKGHDVFIINRVAGGMNGVLRDIRTGMLHGGACWRADGASMGISGGKTVKELLEPDPLY